MPGDEPLAVGLDLGSSRIKAATLDAAGRLGEAREAAAPALRGDDPIREGDADAYERRAREVVEPLLARRPHVPLGLTTQRSTFVVWERATARPLTPLISWQDRRAADWCARHAELNPRVVQQTGLLLSAHYAGPKLALLLEADPALVGRLADGRALFGNLDAWLIWRWTAGRVHATDLSMAARTAMLDIASAAWSPELLRAYGVPRAALPEVVPSAGRRCALDIGGVLTASLADQAAGVLAVSGADARTALVTLGTGGFVLRPEADPSRRLPGYLAAPLLWSADDGRRFALEGTINGAGAALDRFGRPAALPANDPTPNDFAIPDAGLGSPYWRPEIGPALSSEAARLDRSEQARIVLEGLLFRIRQVLDDLYADAAPERVLVVGGLSRNAAVLDGLAALLERDVERVVAGEGGILGAARLAAGRPPWGDPATEAVTPGPAGSYLPAKYARWRHWLAGLLAG